MTLKKQLTWSLDTVKNNVTNAIKLIVGDLIAVMNLQLANLFENENVDLKWPRNRIYNIADMNMMNDTECL